MPLAVLWSLLAWLILLGSPAAATMPDGILSDAPSLEELAVANGRTILVARRGSSFGSTRRPTSSSPTPGTLPTRAPSDASPSSRPSQPASVQPNHALPALGTGVAVGVPLGRALRSEETSASSESSGETSASGTKELLLAALLGVCVFSIVLLFTPMARVFGEPDEAAPKPSTGPAARPGPDRASAVVAAARSGFGRR